MTGETKTYPLRLPLSLKEAVVKIAKQEGTSINQFVATAVAEKISALNTEAFFAERRERADDEAFERILNREGGVAPREGDEFQFPFGDRAAIENLAKLYWEADLITPAEREAERDLIPKIVERARQRGYLLKNELAEFDRWKNEHYDNQNNINENSPDKVKDLSAKALAAQDRKEALEHLDELKGVGLPTASAILHWFRPDDTPIIDIRVVNALGYQMSKKELQRKLVSKEKYDFYAEIAEQVIREAKRVNVGLRDMDRALWAWQKAYGRKQRTGRACA